MPQFLSPMPPNDERYNILRRDDGAKVVEWGGMRFTFWIPSRKREEVLAENPLLSIANVFVNEEEVDSYSSYLRRVGSDAPVFPHDTLGLPRIRNQILDRFFRKRRLDAPLDAPGEDFIVMCDDDVRELRYSYTLKLTRLQRPDQVVPRLVMNALCAAEMPTGSFWFQQSPRPQERTSLQPIRLRAWGRGDLFGIVDEELRFDPATISCEDMDYAFQTISKYGGLWMDMRYLVICLVGRGRGLTGGDAGVVSKKEIDEGYSYLARKWGSDIVRIGEGKKRGLGYQISVKIPQRFEDQSAAKRREINLG